MLIWPLVEKSERSESMIQMLEPMMELEDDDAEGRRWLEADSHMVV